MAKKQKKVETERVPSKRQLSKWQRQMKIRRIVIIAAAVFLAGIIGWASYGYYKDKIEPFRETVIKVNGTPFTMGYYTTMLDVYTKGIEQEQIYSVIYSMANMIADNIINGELMRQQAKNLGIEVSSKEIDAKIEDNDLPNDKVYRDIISTALLQEKLREYFDSGLPDSLEQAQVQVMLVESQELANEVMAKIEAGGNFTALADEFSCNPQIEGDLGWLPRELMPNTLVADAAFNLALGEISQPIYDESATKSVGYWLIEVGERRDEEIKARAILLGSEAEAEQVKADLASGNFSSLAEEYSQHKSKTEGGELGWLKQGDMGSQAFDKVAFSINLNELSTPVKDESVQTTGGYWIVKVLAKGEHQLEGEVREGLRDKHLSDWFQEQKQNSTIENLLDEEKISWAVNKVLQGR